MKTSGRIIAAAAAIVTTFSFVYAPCVYSADTASVSASAEYPAGTVFISSTEEFEQFAESCRLDSFSRGKTFVLKCDINLSRSDIKCIPTFSGTFDGDGHEISGISIRGNGSYLGLFRYVEEGGTVRDLRVSAGVTPSGTASYCGGIAGVNRGRIINCSFNGSVKGSEKCGGIAGQNEENALIAGCSVSGRVEAEHFSGGVAGENLGIIINCENGASVNTNEVSGTLDINDISVDDIYSAENILDITDCGGIAGFSSGAVQNCINRGKIGYPHIGYNIGGICGRQNGYVSGCENYGEINGRKDTGGIVGQAEPYFSLLFSDSSVNKLHQSLDELNTLLDDTIDHTDSSSDLMSSDIELVIDQLEDARSSSDSFMEEADRIINADIDSINELSSRAYDITDMAEGASEEFTLAADSLTDCFDSLEEAFDYLSDAADSGDTLLDGIFPEIEALSDAMKSMKEANESLEKSLDSLKKAMGDPEKTRQAMNDLSASLSLLTDAAYDMYVVSADIADSLDEYVNDPEIKTAAENIRDGFKKLADSSEKLADDAKKIQEQFDEIGRLIDADSDDVDLYLDCIGNIIDICSEGALIDTLEAVSDISQGISTLISSDAAERFKDKASEWNDILNGDSEEKGELTQPDMSEIHIENIYDAVDHLSEASNHMTDTGDGAQSFVDKIIELYPDAEEGSASLIAAAEAAADASAYASEASEHAETGAQAVDDIVNFLKDKEKIEFVGADDSFVSSRDQLSGSLADLLDRLDSLNGSVNDSTDTLSDDLRAINDKAQEVYDTLFDMIDEIKDKPTDIEDYTEDISASDTKGRSDGKIADSVNYGTVNGDVSVGGIAGAMAVENTFDPENDIDQIGDRSFDFMYQSKTVVRECINRGEVISKKDNAGGIAGEMNTGCIIGCSGLGNVSSKDGSYVGGIAGKSDAAVFGSNAMCRISGDDHIGGIAGKGHDISRCISYCIIEESDEFSGAVAGECDGELDNNVFAENGDGAVDGISYSGKAYPVGYAYMLTLRKLPEEFSELTLRFMADDREIKTVSFHYGDSIDPSEIPEVPAKNGSFGKWEDFDYGNVMFSAVINAEYSQYLSTIPSEAQRENGMPVFLAEGSFSDSDVLKAEFEPDSGLWKVELPDDISDETVIRYLPEADPGKTEIFINGVKAASERDGSYIKVTVSEKTFTLYSAEKKSDYLIIAAAGCAVIAAVIAVIAIKSSKKKKMKV